MRKIALALVLAAAALSVAGCGGGGAQTRTFTQPSSAMEPTLHCAKPDPGCGAQSADRLVVQLKKAVKRGDIIVFQSPRKTAFACGEGGIFIKRIVGLPGETVSEDGQGVISIDGKRLNEPYVSARARSLDTNFHGKQWTVPAGDYFVLGDNRSESCDSRLWGGVPKANIIGPMVKVNRG